MVENNNKAVKTNKPPVSGWFFDKSLLGEEAEQLFCTMETASNAAGVRVSGDQLCQVTRTCADGQDYYVKNYYRSAKGVGQFLVKSKAQAEWENLRQFKAWGVPTAQVVACGQDGLWHYPRRAVLVTAGIPGTTDLATLAKQNPKQFNDRQWLDQIINKLAWITKILHQHRFAHNDLKWRNILVTTTDQPEVFLIDCPSGRRWWQPFFNYRRIKDIACLDKVAKQILSATERLKFYKLYKGIDRLSGRDKREIKIILQFFAGRE